MKGFSPKQLSPMLNDEEFLMLKPDIEKTLRQFGFGVPLNCTLVKVRSFVRSFVVKCSSLNLFNFGRC